MRVSQAVQRDRDVLKQFQESAERCHTPEQFRALVNDLRAILPYQRFICAWGYLPDYALGFIYTHAPLLPTSFTGFSQKAWCERAPLFRSGLAHNGFRCGRMLRAGVRIHSSRGIGRKLLKRGCNTALVEDRGAEEGIAQRTVTMHLQRIKKKLYTDDLVNAAVIAVKSFHVDEVRNERCWPREHGHF